MKTRQQTTNRKTAIRTNRSKTTGRSRHSRPNSILRPAIEPVLMSLAGQIPACTDPGAISRAVYEALKSLIPCRHFSVIMETPARDGYPPLFVHGRPTNHLVAARVLRTGKLIITSPEAGGEVIRKRNAGQSALLQGTWVGIPIPKKGRTAGAMIFLTATKNTALVHSSVPLFWALSSILSSAVQSMQAGIMLAESDARFRNLVEHSLVGVYTIQDGRFLDANERMAEIFGYTRRQFVGPISVMDVVHPEDRSLVADNIRRRTAGDVQSVHYMFRGLKKDGSVVEVEVFGSRMDSGGTPAIIGMCIDVTQRRRAEYLEHQQGAAMRASMDGMAILDESGNYIYLNHSHALIYGYSRPDELIGRSWKVLYDAAEGERISRDVMPVLMKSGEWRGEAIGKRKDGSLFPQEISLNMIHGSGMVCIVRDITDRRTSQEELVKLRKAVDSAGEAIFMTDRNGVFTYVNPGFRRLYGYSPSEVVGKTSPRILKSGNMRKEEYATFWNTLLRKEILRGELLNRTKDGRLVDIETSIISILDDRGEISGFLAIQNDISERKRSERELRGVNRSLRTISQCNEALVHATDERRLLDDICRIIVGTGGYPLAWVGMLEEGGMIRPVSHAGGPDTIHGEIPVLKIGSGQDEDDPLVGVFRTGQPAVIRDMETILSNRKWRSAFAGRGITAVIIYPLRVNDATLGVLCICSGAPGSFNDGEVRLLNELAEDLAYGISSLRTRRDHERAMRKISEQAALLDVATDAIMVWDLEGTILFWNRGAERLYGWPLQDTIGRNAGKLLFRKGDDQVVSATGVVSARGSWIGELRQTTRLGAEIVVESRWTLLRDEAGAPTSLLIVNTDITEKKKMEAQFLRAQRMEGIGTLAGGIAHDLNNVLTPVLMSVDVLRSRHPDRETGQVLDLLESTAKRGASMVQQVLSFARGIDGERIAVHPRHLLREIEKIASETFPKSIRIRVFVPKQIGMVVGDATQLHQVLLNLTINSRDAMPDGGILTLSAEQTDVGEDVTAAYPGTKPGPFVILQVSDTGVGMPPEIINKIFEPFFTTKPVGTGTGLGLSTVHTIVQSHGGFIQVESRVGSGTSFRVYLPCEEEPSIAQAHEEVQELLVGNGETILLVDDESSIRSIAREMLESFNYRALTASDGAEAVAIYVQRRNDIAMVITDMLMPTMDGTATIRALRNMNQEIRIIAVSGLTQRDYTPASPPPGADAFLQKPFSTEQLLTAIHTVMRKAEPASGPQGNGKQ